MKIPDPTFPDEKANSSFKSPLASNLQYIEGDIFLDIPRSRQEDHSNHPCPLSQSGLGNIAQHNTPKCAETQPHALLSCGVGGYQELVQFIRVLGHY
eukprot:sb/3479075/